MVNSVVKPFETLLQIRVGALGIYLRGTGTDLVFVPNPGCGVVGMKTPVIAPTPSTCLSFLGNFVFFVGCLLSSADRFLHLA